MIAILLAAGFGTRLYPLTRTTPKALLEVAGRRVADLALDSLLEIENLAAIHVVTNAQFAGQFYVWQQERMDALRAHGVSFFLHSDASLDENRRRGSVGALDFALQAVPKDEPAVIFGDDTILRFPLAPVARRFEREKKNFVFAVPEPNFQLRQRLTVVELAEDGRVARLYPQPEAPPTDLVCPMMYFLQPEALAHVPLYLVRDGEARDSLPAFMDALVQQEAVYAVRLPEVEQRTWFDIETKYMYKRANETLQEEPLLIEGLLE